MIQNGEIGIFLNILEYGIIIFKTRYNESQFTLFRSWINQMAKFESREKRYKYKSNITEEK